MDCIINNGIFRAIDVTQRDVSLIVPADVFRVRFYPGSTGGVIMFKDVNFASI